jgi:hypothetical protein
MLILLFTLVFNTKSNGWPAGMGSTPGGAFWGTLYSPPLALRRAIQRASAFSSSRRWWYFAGQDLSTPTATKCLSSHLYHRGIVSFATRAGQLILG